MWTDSFAGGAASDLFEYAVPQEPANELPASTDTLPLNEQQRAFMLLRTKSVKPRTFSVYFPGWPGDRGGQQT